MFIDYLTLLLVNMTAGHVLLAAYLYKDPNTEESEKWAPGFAIVGLVAAFFGAMITLTWPLPGPYNSIYGEMSVLFGVLFLGASLGMTRGWSLTILGIYSFFAGVAAILLGLRIALLMLTQNSILTLMGFFLSGIAGVGAGPYLIWFRKSSFLRSTAIIILLLAALIWAFTGYGAYWEHLKLFNHLMPKG